MSNVNYFCGRRGRREAEGGERLEAAAGVPE
jgi:hypothetical protein